MVSIHPPRVTHAAVDPQLIRSSGALQQTTVRLNPARQPFRPVICAAHLDGRYAYSHEKHRHGWPESPEATDDETILSRLLVLNLERGEFPASQARRRPT